MTTSACPGCKAPLKSGARFCSGCGYQVAERAADSAQRAVYAMMVVFGGVLLTLIASTLWQTESLESDGLFFFGHLFTTLGFLGCGLLALPLLGRGAWETSLAGTCGAKELALGALVGVAAITFSFGYVALLNSVFVSTQSEEMLTKGFEPSLLVLFATTVLLPVISEEWTTRGVLWAAVRRVSGPGAAIFGTAFIFAFMHGLNGTLIFEVPHRFVGGVLLGWVRHRSGSLWPCVVGHAVWNSIALFAL